MPQVKVKVKCDKKGLLQLRARFKKLDDWSTQAGFWNDQRHPKNGMPAGELAHDLEFGSRQDNIPPRPFITDGAMDSLIDLRTVYSRQFHNFVHNKKTPRDVLQPIGMIIADWISTRILFNNYQPNTAFTEAQKGFNRPLFETGWLARNVQTKTRHKGVS